MMMSPGGGTVNRWIDCLFFLVASSFLSLLAVFSCVFPCVPSCALSVFFLTLGSSAYGCGFIFFFPLLFPALCILFSEFPWGGTDVHGDGIDIAYGSERISRMVYDKV
jgi:hypothetical protein